MGTLDLRSRGRGPREESLKGRPSGSSSRAEKSNFLPQPPGPHLPPCTCLSLLGRVLPHKAKSACPLLTRCMCTDSL